MTTTETILQCGNCLRQHDGKGDLLPLRFCIPDDAPCNRPDCEEIKDRRARAEQVKKDFKRYLRPATKQSGPARGSCAPAREARSPYKDDEREYVQSPRSEVQPPANLMSQGERQAVFESSGAAESANARILKFLSERQNLGQWFKATFLESLGGSTRMNNRAIDLRKMVVEGGLYIDQCTMSSTEENGLSGPKSSHYRLCKIEESLSLTAEQKRKMTEMV